jgi:hypothetical protein
MKTSEIIGGMTGMSIDVRARVKLETRIVDYARSGQRIRDNRRINIDEIVPEVDISPGKKLCKNGLRPNRKHLIFM